jgi:hypothetical protein
VALDCKEGKNPTKMLKHVQIINNCTCAKCQETPAVAPSKKLSNEVDDGGLIVGDADFVPSTVHHSKQNDLISTSVRRTRLKINDGVRQQLLRTHRDEIQGLNSQYLDADYDADDEGLHPHRGEDSHRKF